MYLGLYRFNGNKDEFLVAYERLLQMMPPENLHLQVCISDENGLSIYDACPSKEIFEKFSSSAELQSALMSVGLPQPEISQLGEVHATYLGGKQVL